MGNETVKPIVKNNLRSSDMMVATNEVIRKIQAYAETTKLDYSPYAIQCVDGALSKINDMLVSEGQNWNFFNTPKGIDNLFSVLKYIAFLELNVANQEVAITFRNVKDKEGNSTRVLETKIQGVGNDRILKKFGQDVAEVKSYLVYDGDEFTFPYIDGFTVVLPKHKPMFKSEKVMYGVYLIKLKNGDFDVTIATREDVKVSLLAHINQNMRFNKKFTTELQAELEKLTLDEILYNEKYSKMTLDGTRLISPAWGDFAKERMIARKIRNHALRKWSHNLNFGKKELYDIYEEGFEDERYQTISHTPQQMIENNQQEFEKENSSVKVEETVKGVGEKVVAVEEEVKEPIPVVVETKKEETKQDDDIPEYLRL